MHQKLKIIYNDFRTKLILDGEEFYNYKSDKQYIFEALCEKLGLEVIYEYDEELE